MVDLLHTVRQRLLNGGVPRRRVERYIAELNDHLDDLTEALSDGGLGVAEARAAALVRLGCAEVLVESMMSNRRLRAWPHRVPWAVFVVAPALVQAAGIGLAIGWLVVTASAARTAPVTLPAFVHWGVPVLTVAALMAIAVRSRVAFAWPFAGMSLVVVLANATQLNLTVTSGQAHTLALSVGLPSIVAVVAQGGLAALILVLLRGLGARTAFGVKE